MDVGPFTSQGPRGALACAITAAGLLAIASLVAGCGDGGGDSGAALGPAETGAQRPDVEASITVASAADADQRDDALTLREAVLLVTGRLETSALSEKEAGAVEGSPGPESTDAIRFDLEVFSESDPATIILASSLPPLDSGFDVVDASGAGVVVDGGSGDFPCFDVASPGNELRGLLLQMCRTAILLRAEARGNVIGGAEPGQGNVIGDNVVGIEVRGRANRFWGNYIGTDPSGTQPRPNEFEGIWVAPGATDNVIGGTEPGQGNLISGNELFGISIDGEGTTGNIVVGNLVGTDASGAVPLGNKYGIIVQGGARDNVIGSAESEGRNVISGNNTGVTFRHVGTSGNLLQGNYLGADASGGVPVPNVKNVWVIEGASGNVVEDNLTLEGR